MLRRLQDGIDEIGETTLALGVRRLPADARLCLLILVLLGARLLLYAAVAGAFATLPTDLCVWDCNWFVGTAQTGYDLTPHARLGATHGQANWVNFPVFPGLIHIVSALSGISGVLAAFIIANVALAVFLYVTAKYLEIVLPAASPVAIVLFLLAFPYGFYFSLGYTESPYAAVSMVAFYCLARGAEMPAAIAACVLSATRVTGVLLAPVIAAPHLRRAYADYRRAGWQAGLSGLLPGVLPVAIAPLGLFAYMFYLYCHAGDALGFLHVQRAWARTEENPATVLWHGLFAGDLAKSFRLHKEDETFGALCAVAGLLVTLRLLVLRRFAEGWFLLASILIALSAGLLSFPRYCLANPIFLVGLFELFWTWLPRRAFALVICIFVCLQLYLIHLWLGHNGSFI